MSFPDHGFHIKINLLVFFPPQPAFLPGIATAIFTVALIIVGYV